jgi:acetyl-CoA synthetase
MGAHREPAYFFMTQPGKTISTDSLLQESRTFPPSADAVKRAHINAETYQKMYERSVNDSDAFWLEQCNTL